MLFSPLIFIPEGKFVFTVYTAGHPDSLDTKFSELGESYGVRKEEFIKGDVVNIQRLAKQLEKRDNVDKSIQRSFWLDLDQIRIFGIKDIEKWIKDSGLKIIEKEDIRCGMFPFAYRLVYVLEN